VMFVQIEQPKRHLWLRLSDIVAVALNTDVDYISIFMRDGQEWTCESITSKKAWPIIEHYLDRKEAE